MSTKKRGAGCIVAVVTVGGLGLVALITIFVVVLRPSKGSPFESVGILRSSQKAPGMKELRALGCMTAYALDSREQAIVFPTLGPRDGSPPAALTITCTPRPLGATPTCDEVAQTYVRAIGGQAPGDMDVFVLGSDPKSTCSERYYGPGKHELQ